MLDLLETIKARPELAVIFAALSSMIIYQLKTLPSYFWQIYTRFCTINLEVDSNCEAFYLLDKWLVKQDFSNKNRNLQLTNSSIWSEDEIYFSSKQKQFIVNWRLTTGFGFYIFIYKKTIIFYIKSRRQIDQNSNGNRNKEIINGKLTAFTRNRQLFIDIVDELLEFNKEKEGTPIYIFKSGGWCCTEHRKVRPLHSVILKNGQMDKIVGEIDFFLSSKEHYINKGIPYRKGHLFSGPPGTGKTSTILSLTSYYNRSIYIINLSTMLNDNDLLSAISETKPGSFIVIEDIDCASAVKNRNSDTSKIESQITGVTTQGLLNILDGITTPEDRLYFMTTNHPEKLDPAFLRPGRVDSHEVLDKLVQSDQVRMGKFFYDNYEFTGCDFPVSPAELQKAFILYSTEPEKARQYLLYNKENL